MSSDATFSYDAGQARQAPRLDWSRLDIENKLLFPAGRFTRPNNFLTFILGAIFAALFYAALIPIRGTAFAAMWMERGPTPYAIMLLTMWAVAILFVKWRKLALQRRALSIRVMPDDPTYVLSAMTVEPVLTRVYASVDDPRNFMLFNRIVVALSNLRNLGRVGDVDELLRSQAAQDESAVETSYAVLSGLVWAIPVLGFIGTVMGLSSAIGEFSGVLGAATDVEQITESLKGVTGGLSTAFETTLEALVCALLVQLSITFLRKNEEEFLDEAMDYGIRFVVSRLRILSVKMEAGTDGSEEE